MTFRTEQRLLFRRFITVLICTVLAKLNRWEKKKLIVVVSRAELWRTVKVKCGSCACLASSLVSSVSASKRQCYQWVTGSNSEGLQWFILLTKLKPLPEVKIAFVICFWYSQSQTSGGKHPEKCRGVAPIMTGNTPILSFNRLLCCDSLCVLSFVFVLFF